MQQLTQAQLGEAWTLAEMVPERKREKYDSYLPENLQLLGYASQAFDISATQKWLQQFADTKPELSQA
ncbi:hypothetical protein [Snodgrassella communis]|uniref:hypothetical protein n=1 Tax=Snodgrassella communis TaxID=2946699 RepID=UPI001EF7477F|nr:hypothetical protein [Snodgrassella communis]